MYKEIIYKTNKPRKRFGFLTRIALDEIGMFSLFNIGPFHDGLLKLGYLRIYGEEEYVNRVINKFEFFFLKFNIKAKLKKYEL